MSLLFTPELNGVVLNEPKQAQVKRTEKLLQAILLLFYQ